MVLLPFFGIIISGYLTWQHYGHIALACPKYFSFIDCGQVLTSKYSEIFGVPLALLGFIFYIFETIDAFLVFNNNKEIGKYLLLLFSTGGFLFSCYLVSLMVFVIHAICIYCMGSAIVSALVFVVIQVLFGKERRNILILLSRYVPGRQ